MKGLLFFVMFVTSLSCIAKPTAPVSHAHNGRMHTHPLPVIGVGHRHGNGSSGVMAKSTGGTITSSVTYGGVKPAPNSSQYPSQNQSQQPNQQQSIRSNVYQNQRGLDFTRGDIRCRKGDSSCNVCASNVQQQFSQAASGRLRWKTTPWHFTWPKRYPPFNKRPLDFFDGDPAYALGIPDTHVQGFARTNSSQFPFVGSHSHKRQGGIFVVAQQRNGQRHLSSLHPTKSRHPSGIQVIGDYLVYGDAGRLYFKNLKSRNQMQGATTLSLPKANFGGGLGLLKLSGNNLLLVTSGPGGQNGRPRYNRFYHLKTRNSLPYNVKYLGESKVNNPSQWPRGLAFSENLSLITECGTGDIYSIHTGGDQKGIKAISGNGYWRLSKLNRNQGKLSLSPINAFITRQNMTNCNVRAAATVHVNSQHRLEFYCHGYAKDPDGSDFNVLGRSSRAADKFYFRTGTLY